MIPILLNDNPVHRPLFLPEADRYALVGDLGGKFQIQDRTVHLSSLPWRGALALAPGHVQLVIHGVAYCQIDSPELGGTIYCDQLQRDISKEKVVRDSSYTKLLGEIEFVRHQLYQDLALGLADVEDSSHDEYLVEFMALFLTKRLNSEAEKQIWTQKKSADYG